MRKVAIILIAALTACTAKAPLSLDVVRSEIARNSEATCIDGQEGRLKWNYTTGLELKAMLDVYCHSERSEESILEYVDSWYNAIIDSTGSIFKYRKSNYSLDHICPGRTLFQLYDLTGREKYRAAMDSLYIQLLEQPRTPEGGFWHKAIYPDQMWLDGLYMAEPFYAEYTVRFVADSLEREENFRDIAHQFQTVFDYTFDPETGLLRHAWDSSHQMFWSDPETGQSAHAWGRAMGWYAMALVDVIEIMPSGEEHDQLVRLLNRVFDPLPLYADARTGMWYQVLDRPYEEGNYLEATCSAMFTYALLKGTRLGVLEGFTSEDAVTRYNELLNTFVTRGENGLVNLNDCCEVAGLGGRQSRSGDYDYYISEPVRSNDPKGIGPLIWAALEFEQI